MSRTPSMLEGEILAGKFRVERVLGVGGMGVVLAATHLQLDQLVALKFVVPGTAPAPAALERFQREARAAVRLKSEHVARVLDVGTLPPTTEGPGAPYIVMEYLEGHDLGSYAHGVGGKLVIAEACDFVLQACEAIAEAHAIGIVHRDLKPSNLFVTRALDGRPFVKVLDFGISKIVSPEKEAMSLTRTSEVIGSPNYMSPEQLRSARDVDARTDIWSLGVILYELIAGIVPFPADSLTQLTAKVLQDPPVPLRSIRADVPQSLAMLVNHCLEKDREARFQSVGEMARVLEPFAGGRSAGAAARIAQVEATRSSVPFPAARPSRTRVAGPDGTAASWGDTQAAPSARRSKWIAGGAALATFVVVGAALSLRSRTDDPVPPASASASATATASASATASATTSASASATASASAPASAPPSPSTSVAARATNAPPPRPRPSASAPPSDGLPSERH